MTYKDAAKRAGFLKEVTASRRMPPWKPESGFGEFRDVRGLSDEELDVLKRWAETGAAEGDPKDLPEEPKFVDGWRLGKPDLVLKMPKAITVPADGREIFRDIEIPTGLTEDATVGGWEFRPGNPRVLHHVNIRIGLGNQIKKKAKLPMAGLRPAIAGSLGGWVPGTTPFMLPDNVGALLRKGSTIVLQLHYHPIGKVEEDQSTIVLYFTKKPAENLVIPLSLGSTASLYIPAGEKDYRTKTSYTLPTDVQVMSISPHMHLLGRQMKVKAILPDGKIQPLIWIKDWDFNWQGHYPYVNPVPLPKGTVLEMHATFDNSDENPKNPFNPPKLVKGGPATTDEMCQCNVLLVTSKPEERPVFIRDMIEKFKERREVQMMERSAAEKSAIEKSTPEKSPEEKSPPE